MPPRSLSFSVSPYGAIFIFGFLLLLAPSGTARARIKLTYSAVAVGGSSFRSGDGAIFLQWDFYNDTSGFSAPGIMSADLTPAVISANVTCAVTGWCAFGFGPDQLMPYTDIFWGFVDSAGVGHAVDRFSLGYYRPPADTYQDINLVGYSQNSTHTTLQYTRLLDTCHTSEDYALTAGPRWLLFSMSTSDPTAPQGTDPDWTFVQHTYTGTQYLSTFNSPLVTAICTPPPPTTRPPPPPANTVATSGAAGPSPSSGAATGSSASADSKDKSLSAGVVSAIVLVPCLVIGIAVLVYAIVYVKVLGKGGNASWGRPGGKRDTGDPSKWVIDLGQ